MNIVVNLAVITFNHGMRGLQPLVKSVGPLCNEYLMSTDRHRLDHSVKRSKDRAKKNRKPQDSIKLLKNRRKYKKKVIRTNLLDFDTYLFQNDLNLEHLLLSVCVFSLLVFGVI